MQRRRKNLLRPRQNRPNRQRLLNLQAHQKNLQCVSADGLAEYACGMAELRLRFHEQADLLEGALLS